MPAINPSVMMGVYNICWRRYGASLGVGGGSGGRYGSSPGWGPAGRYVYNICWRRYGASLGVQTGHLNNLDV